MPKGAQHWTVDEPHEINTQRSVQRRLADSHGLLVIWTVKAKAAKLDSPMCLLPPRVLSLKQNVQMVTTEMQDTLPWGKPMPHSCG